MPSRHHRLQRYPFRCRDSDILAPSSPPFHTRRCKAAGAAGVAALGERAGDNRFLESESHGGYYADGEPSPEGPPDRFSFSTFGSSLSFAYELDFWGELNSGRRAAMADFMATGADVRTVEISVASETISAYFELRELRTRATVLDAVVDILSERLELTEDRYRRGRRHID